MKTHTNNYKTNIAMFGRQLDSIITYTIDNEIIELGAEELNSITPHYKGDILKSVMKQLDIDSNVEIPVGTEINYKFGVKVGDSYEYLDFGNYIVYSVQKLEDYRSWQIICYDKMLYSMVNYESMGITYPITIRNYINAICTHLGLQFKNINDTFANYDKEIANELYLDENGGSLGYTFRDVLDELAQVTASTICINEANDKLEIRYITNTNDTIDEEYLKDVNVKFGEIYGPINTITFKRSADSDIISLSNPVDLADDEKVEIAIKDNQILNGNDRSDYLQDILDTLYGLQYSINDFSSPGITYYDLCDRYSITIDNKTYSCIMLNNEVLVTQGLQENVYTDMPEISKTDYTKTDKTDRRINQTYIIVDKVNGRIDSVADRTTVLESDNVDIKTKFGNYTLKSEYATLKTSVEQIQTDTYTRTDIKSILKGTFYDENNNQIVSEIVRTTSGTFDENGMTYEKSNAQTKTTINEVGVNTRRTSNNETILFAGYVDDDNTQFPDFKGQTIVATENIQVKNYFVMPDAHSRIEKYEDGGGMFYV